MTGPWGSGKTTLVANLPPLLPGYIVLDWDTLLPGLSQAVGRPADTDPSAWPALATLWADILRALHAGGHSVVLCGPATPETFAGRLSVPLRCAYLDCTGDALRQRLHARGEQADDIAEELAFAVQLRASPHARIRADGPPPVVAARVAAWIRQSDVPPT